ncbi:MAG: hypothetical protein HN348_34320, partial [Proteobacteria bacterium]|nr:hypothetical protein [Pseudomonadota bacterium]
MEIRHRGQVAGWLSAGLCLTRVERPSASALEEATLWVLGTVSETPALPPPGAIADIGKLVSGSKLNFSGANPPGARLRDALRAYEDQVLGRLANDPRIEAVSDAIARLPARNRGDGIGLFVSQLLQRMNYQGGVLLSPGAVRSTMTRPAEDVLHEGLRQIRDDVDELDHLALGYELLVRAVRQTGTLVGDAEVFALENLKILKGLAQ